MALMQYMQAGITLLIEDHRKGKRDPQVEVFLRRSLHAADEYTKQELKKFKYLVEVMTEELDAMTEDNQIIGEDPLAQLSSECADETLELTTQSGADSSAASLPKRVAAKHEVETEQSDIEHTRNVLRNELDAKSADSDNENK